MGMYTEFYFRANVKDGPVADWLDQQINGEEWFAAPPPGDEHPFFTCRRWDAVFVGGGAVYQESRRAVFRLKSPRGEPYRNELVVASSLKNYGDEIGAFVDWITPHLDHYLGDFLGYSLYEDSQPSGYGWGSLDRHQLDDTNSTSSPHTCTSWAACPATPSRSPRPVPANRSAPHDES